MNRDEVVIRLELIATKAKQLADDVKNNRLWEGELSKGLSEIGEQLQMASRNVTRND